jgi:hypothetical protein
MEHSQIIYRFLFPTDENPAEAIDPGGDALDHPASRTTAVGAFGDLFLTARLDMRSVTASAGFPADSVGVKTLVAAQMLRTPRGGAGTADRDTVERGVKEFLVMHICAGNCHAQGHAPAIGQHRSLHAQFASIRGVFPGFFPRPREPWLSIRRDFATSTECREGGRTVVADTSTIGGRRPAAPIPGSSDAMNCRSRIPVARLSIDNLYAKRRKYRRRLAATPIAVAHPREICDILAKTFPSGPRGLREYANLDTFVQRAYDNPP